MGLLSSGNKNQEVTQKFVPNAFQKAVLREIQPLLLQALREGLPETPQIFGGYRPEERAGIEWMKALAGTQQDTGAALNQGLQFLMGPVLGPNPALQGAIDAATEPLYRRLTTDVLPQVRGQAVATGSFGGSRQGIAEGLATEGTARAAANAAAQLALGGYQSGLEAMVKGLGLSPTVLQAMGLPAQQLMLAGQLEREEEERLKQEAAQREVANRLRNVGLSQEIARVVFGMPGGAMVTTTPAAAQTNPVASGLGGALAGAQLASTFGLPAPVGAGIGLLLGLL